MDMTASHVSLPIRR